MHEKVKETLGSLSGLLIYKTKTGEVFVDRATFGVFTSIMALDGNNWQFDDDGDSLEELGLFSQILVPMELML